jgi:hypothetical protein
MIDRGRLVLLNHGLYQAGWFAVDRRDGTALLRPVDGAWPAEGRQPRVMDAPLRPGGRSWWQWVPEPGGRPVPICYGNEVGKAVRLIGSTLDKARAARPSGPP